MKKLISISVLLLLISIFFSQGSLLLAHTAQSDGSIGAIIHVDPEDDPVVGKPANFFFEFNDKAGKFDTKKCSCQATIQQSGTEIFSTNLFAHSSSPSLQSSSFSYTFTERGIYQITVSGTSTDGSFSPFTLNYDLRVSREEPKTSSKSIFQHWRYGLFALAGIIGFGFFAYERRRSKGPIKNSKEEENV